MNTTDVNCQNCNSQLPTGFFNIGRLFSCPSCNSYVRVDAFPALFRPDNPASAAEKIILGNEASCFYHPSKKASIDCSSCGRFLCSLCDIDMNGRHICPQCLESGVKSRKVKNLENRTVLYDKIAVALAVYPMLIFWLTIITAPVSIFISIKYWNAPSSVLPRTKIRFIEAIILASLQLIGWIIAITYTISKI